MRTGSGYSADDPFFHPLRCNSGREDSRKQFLILVCKAGITNKNRQRLLVVCFWDQDYDLVKTSPSSPVAGHAVHAVVCIGNYITVTIRHEDKIYLLVVLIGDGSFGRSYSGYLPDFVVAAFNVLIFAGILGKQIAGLVIGKGEYRAICLGDGAEPAFGGVCVFHGVAQSVGFGEQVAVLVVGVTSDLLERIRYLGDVIQGIVAVAGFVARLVDNGSQAVDPIILVPLGVALAIGLADHIACKVVGQALGCAVGVGDLLQQVFHRVGEAGLIAQRVGFAHQIAQRISAFGRIHNKI